MKREWRSSILCMPAVPWYAKIAGSVFRAAITARAARWLRRSPRRSPTGSKSRKRCARLRNTPGRRSPEASVPAWASSSPTAFSGHARAKAGSEAARPVRHHPRSGGERRAVRDAAGRARGRRRACAIPQEEARRSGGKGGRAPCQTPPRAGHRERRYRARAAIGEITLENAPQLISAGADLLAVFSDLFEAPDIGLRARQYGKLFT